jgi:hypothetical protein
MDTEKSGIIVPANGNHCVDSGFEPGSVLEISTIVPFQDGPSFAMAGNSAQIEQWDRGSSLVNGEANEADPITKLALVLEDGEICAGVSDHRDVDNIKIDVQNSWAPGSPIAEGMSTDPPVRIMDTEADEKSNNPTGPVKAIQSCEVGSPGDGVQTNIVRIEIPENPNGYYYNGELAYDGELLSGAYVIAAYDDGTTETKNLDAGEASDGSGEIVGHSTISIGVGDRDWPDGSSTQPDVIGFEARGNFKDGSPFVRVITGLTYEHCQTVNPDEAQPQVFKRIY